MKSTLGQFNTWYKYIEYVHAYGTGQQFHGWNRFTGETQKQGFFKYAKPWTHMEPVPWTHMELAFDFKKGEKALKDSQALACLMLQKRPGPAIGEGFVVDNKTVIRPTFYLTENKKVMRHKKTGYFKQAGLGQKPGYYLISSQNRPKKGIVSHLRA